MTVVYTVYEPDHPDPAGNPNKSTTERIATIPAGSSSVTFGVTAHDDGVVETNVNDRMRVKILSSDNYHLAGTTEIYLDVDDPLSVVSVAADQSSVTEGEGLSFTVTRSASTSHPVTVQFELSDPSDHLRGNYSRPYPEFSKEVEFAAGETSKTVRFQTPDNWRDLPDADVTMTLLPGSGYTLGSESSAGVTVLDNDEPLELELTLDKTTVEEGGEITFTVSLHGTTGVAHVTESWVAYGLQGEEPDLIIAVLEDDDGPSRSITFSTDDNDVDEPDRVFEVTILPIGYSPRGEENTVLTAAEAEYWTVRGPRTVTATVTDNDLPVISVEALKPSYSEGELGKFRLRRAGDTTVTLEVYIEFAQTTHATTRASRR